MLLNVKSYGLTGVNRDNVNAFAVAKRGGKYTDAITGVCKTCTSCMGSEQFVIKDCGSGGGESGGDPHQNRVCGVCKQCR
jgi:hypothetical protein